MAKKHVEQCRTAKEFIQYAEKNGARVEPCKKGVKVYGPNEGYALIHSNHPRELATGTRFALIKALMGIGLAGSIGCMVLSALYNIFG